MAKNVSDLVRSQAKKRPDKESISLSKKKIFGGYSYPSLNFKEFNERINQICHKLVSLGVKPKDRVLFFVKPNLDFCVITFALFRMGAIPVFIDPGMKREHFFACIKEVNPRVMIGIPKVHIIRHLFKDVFKSINIFITTGSFGISASSIYRGLKNFEKEFESYIPEGKDLAAILYTSGGTGKPKGVEYGHDIFINQTRMLQKEFDLKPADLDIPGFPLFSFFTLAMGMSSCIPDMDPSKPGLCDPKKLYQNIQDRKATFIAGSPAIWERLADYCLRENLKLDTVKYVVMFGAPVSVSIHQKFSKVLTNGTTYTPYGATECLPVSNISGDFILGNTSKDILSGRGTCVGTPLSGVKVKIIEQSNNIIKNIEEVTELGINEVGEILVQSPNVTKAYFEQEEATAKAKVYDKNKVWHRMGDVGFIDENNKLWFCGRLKHVVTVNGTQFFPAQVEAIFNQHPKVKRSALIFDQNNNAPAVVIERHDKKEIIEPMFLMDLKNLSQTHAHTKWISDFYAKSPFPVDVRHNIKIDRTKLQSDLMGESK